MARLPRAVVAGSVHLVIHRGHNGQPVLIASADRLAFRDALAAAARDAEIQLHGYGFGSNEVRLLVTPLESASLGLLMQSVGRRFVRQYNARHHRSGTPWEGRFRSTVIDAPVWFMPCLRFVEACASDAVASGDPAASSEAHHLGRWLDDLVTDHPLFWALGNTPFEREAAYRTLLSQPLTSAQEEQMRSASLKGWALGPPDFARAVADATGRRQMPKARGRPVRLGSDSRLPASV
jgi:putative transposase